MKKIIVAGAGHGGLSVAASLAKNGFDVTVIEQKRRRNLGYDWTDIFNINYFIESNIPIPKNINFEFREKMTFYPPSLKKYIKPEVPLSEREIKMERKDIYDILINYAKNSGVKMIFNEKIISSICDKKRVLGIKTDKNSYYGDLVIDACGVNSIIRNSLNDDFGIEKKIKIQDKFYVYRAFYNRISDENPNEKYKIYLMPHNSRGISWVSYENKYIDVLIGRFTKFDNKVVEEELKWLRKHDKIGYKKKRGGQFVEIPIRRPLAQLVYNGYVAIGDSAFMTIPLVGSGISLSVRSSKILTDVLLKKKDTNYNIEDLWEYQVQFFKNIGYELAFKDVFKEVLINLDYDDINYIFESSVVSPDIVTKATNDKKNKFSIEEVVSTGLNAISNPRLLLKLGKSLIRCKQISKHAKNIPIKYSKISVEKWKKRYLEIRIK